MRKGIVVLMMVLGFSVPAWSAFIGGVEEFNGTTKDTATWEEYVSTCTISQNNQLIIDSQTSGKGDYTTTTLMVGIGDSVSVKVTPINTSTYGTIGLWLTNDSKGTGDRTLNDQYFIGLFWTNSLQKIRVMTRDSTPSDKYLDLISNVNQLNTTYIYRIDRTSSTGATFSVYTAGGSLIASNSATFSGIPDDLYISLYVGSAKATFDTVTLIPEPATLALLGLGMFAFGKKRV